MNPRLHSTLRAVAPASVAAALPAIVLTVIAVTQLFAAHAFELCAWKGGGFGMFTNVDRPSARAIQLEITFDDRTTILVPPDQFGLITGWFSEALDRARTIPDQPTLRRLANDALSITYYKHEIDGRPHISVLPTDGAIASQPVVVTVRALAAEFDQSDLVITCINS